jgi:sugar/nucleoside kinase (ribokinase family)
MPEIASVGWLTLDDIVSVDGTVQKASVGGGVLYSAVGAKLWERDVGIHAVCGRESWNFVEPAIAAYGIDTSALTPIDGHGLVLWVLNESETVKQQLPKLHSTPVTRLDEERPALPQHYAGIRGLHVAPQTPFGSGKAVSQVRASHPDAVISVDILADDFIDAGAYRDFALLAGSTIFCPSELEVQRIWNPPDISDWAREAAARHGIHIAVKLGEKGSIVCNAQTGELFHVPICPVDAIDTTGAGDSFSGGLISGLTSGEKPEIAAAMGAVSASYVVEAHGALNTARPSATERHQRLDTVIKNIEKI